jgi:hypothetical protein
MAFDESSEDDEVLVPPTAERVASRAMVLAAVSCRGSIESDAGQSEAEQLREDLLEWLEQIGASSELEPQERSLLSKPLGHLTEREEMNATWRSEGTLVLGWALGFLELLPVDRQCEPSEVANTLGLLNDRENTSLENPKLRAASEIEFWASTYFTLHWRIRQALHRRGPVDLVGLAAREDWGPLQLETLELIENDIAIRGVRIDKLSDDTLIELRSIASERHQALNWLLGVESVYSQVPTDQ